MNSFLFNKTIGGDKTMMGASTEGLNQKKLPFGVTSTVQHQKRVAYIPRSKGQHGACHDCDMAIILLSAIKDLYWTFDDKFGERFDAPAGTVLLLPRNTEYCIEWPGALDTIQIVLDDAMLLDLQDVSGGLKLSELFPYPTRLPNSKALLIANLLRTELMKNAPISDGYVRALLAVLMVQFVQNHSYLRANNQRNEHNGLSYQASRKIEAYLRENYMRKLSILKMASILGVSGGHFLTSFRESFGQTPHQYLLMLRLNAAEELLIGSNISLAEIAHRTGFSSQSHMTTALKKCRTKTPGELRRQSLQRAS